MRACLVESASLVGCVCPDGASVLGVASCGQVVVSSEGQFRASVGAWMMKMKSTLQLDRKSLSWVAPVLVLRACGCPCKSRSRVCWSSGEGGGG